MTAINRDQTAYKSARHYLLGFADWGMTPELLDSYINPPEPEVKHATLNGIYQRLVISAQNANMKAGVVGGSIGGVKKLGKVLFDFNPRKVESKYGSDWEALLGDVKVKLKPSGKIRLSKQSLWPQFCRSVLSSAAFLNQFESAEEFTHWVEFFDKDDRARIALPMLLEARLEGIGFALASDFLKEIGFLNFCKPDVHVIRIFKALGLVPAKAKPYEVFDAVTRVARSNNVTPYNADKMFWLVGSGKLYNHPHLGKKGFIPTDKEKFIQQTLPLLG